MTTVEEWVDRAKASILADMRERAERLIRTAIELCPSHIRPLLTSARNGGELRSPHYDRHHEETAEECFARLAAPLDDLQLGDSFAVGGDAPALRAVEEGTRTVRPHRFLMGAAAEWSDDL